MALEGWPDGQKRLDNPTKENYWSSASQGVRGREQRLPTIFSKSLFSNLVEIRIQLVTTTCGPPTIDHWAIELLIKTYNKWYWIEGSKVQIKYGMNQSEYAISDQSNQLNSINWLKPQSQPFWALFCIIMLIRINYDPFQHLKYYQYLHIYYIYENMQYQTKPTNRTQ